MPRADGSIVIDTKILEDGFKKGVGSLKSMSRAAGIAIASGLAVATAALTAFAVKGIKLASDLQEVQNVVDVTFGKDGAKKIEEWADRAGEAFGLSELQAKRYTGTLGAMLKSMGLTTEEALDMSSSLAGLTGDFASFYNLDHEDAFEKIRSGIAGETEPLKQIGINMSEVNLQAFALAEGIKKPFSEMTSGEKTQLRYAYLMKVSADAQGDFSRTSDSFANQLRTAQMQVDEIAASLGEKLLPAVSKALGGIMDGLDAAGPALEETFSGLADLITGGSGQGLATGLASLAEMLGKGLAAALPRLVNVLTQLLRALIAALPTIIPILVPAIADSIAILVNAMPTLLPPLVDAFLMFVELMATELGEMAPILMPVIGKALYQVAETIWEHKEAFAEAAIQLVNGLLKGLAKAAPWVVAAMWNTAVAMLRAIAIFFGIRSPSRVMNELGQNLIRGLVNGVKALGSLALSAMKNVGKIILDAMKKLPKNLLDIGRDLITGLWNGINDRFGWLTEQLRSFAKNVTDKLKAFFKIKSPSKLFEAEIGFNLAYGVGLGFTKKTPEVFDAMARSVSGEMSRFATTVAPTAISAAVQTSPTETRKMVVNFNRQVRSFSEVVRALTEIERGLAF